MRYAIKPFRIFLEDVKEYDKPSRRLIHEKIELVKENPFRFKKLHSKIFSKVFRVRFRLKAKEVRLIYVVLDPDIILVCLLYRGNEYKQLEKILKRMKKELG